MMLTLYQMMLDLWLVTVAPCLLTLHLIFEDDRPGYEGLTCQEEVQFSVVSLRPKRRELCFTVYQKIKRYAEFEENILNEDHSECLQFENKVFRQTEEIIQIDYIR